MNENVNFYEVRRANADEKEGDFKFVAKEKPTEAELKLLGEGVTAEVCAKYSYYSLESYSITRKVDVELVTITKLRSKTCILMKARGLMISMLLQVMQQTKKKKTSL